MSALPTIKSAFHSRMAPVAGLKGVFGAGKMLSARQLPGSVLDLGVVNFDDLGIQSEPGAPRILACKLQVDIIIVDDAKAEDFAEVTYGLRNAIIAALVGVLDDVPGIESCRLLSATPHEFVSEAGRQGGYHLAYIVDFTVSEDDPGTLLPRY
ncbi:hypothetical protein [Bosea sp. (in: a-proteobacteria)]|uniref:hypothetical protein n=1 Tax=Bosea sp. (in: a-proteobacteria) TaxID=1871050 RepID=UPI002733F45E|nr:hypothetical protein [Bosea sp. (in: a-proteobacteria)]MDP3408075.1 hypothetical protein [Bosea sp. (in: a-proteobacteria)]